MDFAFADYLLDWKIAVVECYSEHVLVLILQCVCQTDRLNPQWSVSRGVRVHSWIGMLSLV